MAQSNVVARGVKLNRSAMNSFLTKHNQAPLSEMSHMEMYVEKMAALFTSLGVKGRLRIFEPWVSIFQGSDYVFLCYDWVYVLASKEVEMSLTRKMPDGYLEVVKQIKEDDDDETHVGTWVVCREDEEWALYSKYKFSDSVGISSAFRLSAQLSNRII